jgi:uncharacterized protein (DUF2235 family)
MALYAFDGTWNKDEAEEGADTNVVKFAEAYTEETCYRPGVGTRFGKIGKIFGGVFGAGSEQRLDEMLSELKDNFAGGDTTIDVIGFSRGAAIALEFCNLVDAAMQAPPIRFVGLWDTVASFGLPGNRINVGHKLTLPDNVANCFHAMALDERRGNFPLTRVVPCKGGQPAAGRVEEVWFRGVHSDVGGGRSIGLSSIALVWMLRRAQRYGLPIDPAEFARHVGLRDSRAPISKNFDPVKDEKRVLASTDLVHESVTPRGRADGKEHNDPLPGMPTAGDN